MRAIVIVLLLELSGLAAGPKLVRTLASPRNHRTTLSSFSVDESMLAMSLRKGEVQLFGTSNGKLLSSLKPPLDSPHLSWLKFSRDGQLLVILAARRDGYEQTNHVYLYRVEDLTKDSIEPWKSIELECAPGESHSYIGILDDRYLILGKRGFQLANVSSSEEKFGGQFVVCDPESGQVESPVIDTIYERLTPPKPRKKQQISCASATLQWRVDDNKLVAHRIYGHKKKYAYHDQMTSIPHITDEVIVCWADGYATSDITEAVRIPLSGTVSPNGRVFAGDWFNLYGKSRKRSDTQHNVIVGTKSDTMFRTVRKVWQPKESAMSGALPLHLWTGDSKRLFVGSPYPSRQPKDSLITIHSGPGRLLTAIKVPRSKSLGLADVSTHGNYVLAVSRRQSSQYKPILELWETGLRPQNEAALTIPPQWIRHR